MTNWSLGNVVCSAGVLWSGLVRKDSQDELVFLYIGFDGSSDDSYGIYAYLHTLEKYEMSCMYTETQRYSALSSAIKPVL